jgi:hypothetical protein
MYINESASLKGQRPTKEVFIYNSLGQIVYQSTISNLQAQMDLSSQPKGIYFVKIQSADKIYTEKVVVQ